MNRRITKFPLQWLHVTKCMPLCWIIAAIIAIISPTSGPCDIVLLKDQAEPIYGKMVSRDEQQIVFNRWNANGESGEQIRIPADNVRFVKTTVDQKKIELISNDLSQSYEYAEELAEMTHDPFAIASAKKLLKNIVDKTYQESIAGKPAAPGRASLKMLLRLAGSSAERRKFQAIALVHDQQIQISNVESNQPARSQPSREQIETLLAAVRGLRKGNRIKAADEFSSESFRALDSVVRSIVSIQALYLLSLEKELNDEQQGTLLRCESHLIQMLQNLSSSSSASPARTASGQWDLSKLDAPPVRWPTIND